MADHGLTLELFYDGAWHPAPVLDRGCTIRRGVTDPGSDSDPALAPVTLPNGDGKYAPLSIISPLYGKIGQNTPARLSSDGVVRLTGEVAEWRPERPIKGSGWTKIQVAGVLRRIGRGTDPVQSAATRAAVALGAVSMWPLEDLAGATTASPVVDGGASLRVGTGAVVDWAADDTLAGSLPLPTLLDSAAAFVSIPTVLSGPVAGTNAAAWTVSLWVKATHGPATVVKVLRWGPEPVGNAYPWELTIFSNSAGFEFTAGYSNLILAKSLGTGVQSFDGAWHHVVVQGLQNGPNVETRLYIDGLLGTAGPTFPDTLRAIKAVEVLPAAASIPAPVSVLVGQVAFFDGLLSAGDIASLHAAGRTAHRGELAADRFVRFLAEEGIASVVVGDPADTVAMGPQRPVTQLELLDEIARTDDAAIFETRDGLGLTMRTGASKLNQLPALTLSYLGQIVPPLRPVVGDAGIRNDVTAYDPAGNFRRVRRLEGLRGVQLPPVGVGRYNTRIDVNPADVDYGLAAAAGWRVNLGTYAGTWYAVIVADLDAAPGLIPVVNVLDIGDVIALTSLPPDEALDTVESLIIGIEDTITEAGKRSTVAFYCVPAEPYRVGKIAATTGDTDPLVGHKETDGSTTVGVTAVGAATFTVATPGNFLWTLTPDDFPFDVIAGGQRVTVQSIAGVTSPQTFTIDPAGRRPVYPIPAGSPVTVQQPIIVSM